MDRLYAIRPLNPNPQSPDHARYQIIEQKPQALATGGQGKWRLPCKDLNLNTNEDLLIVKVKRRPVIVLSRTIVNERQADPKRIQDSFWCIPEYTMVDRFSHPQLDQGLIEDVEALTCRSFFPLPYEPYLHDRQAMLRLDRMQPIQRHLLKPTERRVTKEWVLYLHEWARFYITGEIGDEDSQKNPGSIASTLAATRDALMEKVAKNRAKQKPEGQD